MKTSKRSYQPELLDLGSSFYSPKEYGDCLHQLGRIGRFLGGDRASVKTFSKVPKPQSILDVGCGGGQFTIQLARQFPKAQILGIDISQKAIQFAKKRKKEAKVKNAKFEVPSSTTLSYPSNSFDVVTATLVCHHMNDTDLIDFLKKSYQVANKRVIINDLHRHWVPYVGFALIAKLFFPNRLIYHDGLLSIKKAFKRNEWIDYLQAADIPLEHCSITRHWGFRWIINIDTSFKLEK